LLAEAVEQGQMSPQQRLAVVVVDVLA